MKTDFWHERWENNQIGFHQAAINVHLQDFWSCVRAGPATTVLVPLCGKSADMLWLRSQGFKVLGVELSSIAVRDFFVENQLQAKVTRQEKFERWETDELVILRGDFFELTADDVARCGAVFDRASLIALPPAMRSQYVQHIRQITPADCDTLLITLEYDQSIAGGPPFAVLEDEVRDYYSSDYQVELLRTADASDDLPGLKKRGVSKINEKVYLLKAKPVG